jgi:adenylate cyclase
MTASRRLAAILAADVAGYSRLIGEDEEGTLNRLRSIRTEVLDPKIDEHHGRLVKTTGDGLLVEFGSVINALRCAVEVQQRIAERNIGSGDRIEFRIGINVGDIVVEDGDIFGDGVNVAARLEGLAEPGGICVSARVQEDAAGKLDLTFDDIGEQALKNIARPIRVYRIRIPVAETTPTASATPAVPALALPDKPSIAVLPFQNMSGDPEQDYFVDGMVEEIITALSRIHWLFVIARNSSFTYKGQAVDVKRVGRELGVRYVLEGSVRKGGNRVRITGQLIDAATGTHLWADRFDGTLDDIFALQEDVATSVAGAIEPALQMAEMHRSAERPTKDMTAYDLYLQALPEWQSWERERVERGVWLLQQAIERDPRYGPALATAAFCRVLMHSNSWPADLEETRRIGVDLARRALLAAGDEPGVVAYAAAALAYFEPNVDAAARLLERSLSMNPSFAFGWLLSGFVKLWAGQATLAVPDLERSMRLNPRDRRGFQLTGIGIAHFFDRHFNEAAKYLSLSLEELPSYVATYRFLASALAHLGQIEQAREVIARLRQLTSMVVPPETPYRDSHQRELYLSGLRLAVGEAG